MPDGSPPPDLCAPPHSLESERAMLAALILDPALLPVQLSPAHFYFDAHARTFAAIVALHGRGEPVDLVAVKEELRTVGELGRVGLRELAEVVLDAAPVSDLSAHVAVVREAWRARRLIRVLQTVAAEMYAGLGADEAWRRVREECAG